MSDERPTSTKLEPRVAKLELGLDRLTDDVRDLAQVVRSQGSQMEQEIQKLVVAVTQASGPKKTDWQTIIAGIALIMAIGSAVFWPLSQQLNDVKEVTQQISEKYDEHLKLRLHPVGDALVQRIEGQLSEHIQNNDKQMAAHISDAKEMHATLKTQNENLVSSLEKKVDLHNDRVYGRILRLEEQNRLNDERDKDELQMWRQKAMGLSTTTSPSIHSHLDIQSPSPAK